jgi:acyl-coenzyme A thioesterase PaaI-like protein
LAAATRRFTDDSAVARIDVDRFTAECRIGWRVIGGSAPNGGYLMAIGARAMAARAERPDPVTLTAHFLSPPTLGPLEIVTEMVREGGRHRTVAARILQDGREHVRLLGTFGDLAHADGPTRVLREPPDWPAVESLTDPLAGLRGHLLPEIFDRLDHRMPPQTLGWTRGTPSGAGVHGGYCRWPDDDRMDPFGLLFVADAYPPAVFDLGVSEVAWAPTIELTVQVRAHPAPGWLATRFTTRALTDGYFEEDGELWDSSGRLVAISRQLALAGKARDGQG